MLERPNCLTDEVEAAFIREFPRSPLDAFSVAERALVGSKWENETGAALNIKRYFDETAALRVACLAHCEAINASAEGLPSKEQFAYEILQFARNEKNKTNASNADKEFALRCYRLYAEVASMIDKPAPNGPTNIQINNKFETNKVMILPPEQSLEDWTEETAKQQRKLISAATDEAANRKPASVTA